jgi:hypothetical protein
MEASLNNTFLDSWLALAAGIKAYRFKSCPDYTANDVERDSISFELVMEKWRKEDAMASN